MLLLAVVEQVLPVNILLVEDDPAHVAAIRRGLLTALPDVEVRIAGTLAAFRQAVADRPPDIAMMDMNLPDGCALEVLTSPPEAGPFPVLIMTSYGNEQVAVEALKAGALDYVVKSPEAFAGMPHTVERAMREWNLLQERKRAEESIRSSLAEKELLLKEVHHRVKNNLMTIIGLIKMQGTKANIAMFNPLLLELEGRVRSMALVHESLYKSADLAHVNMQNYIETMGAHICGQFGAECDVRFSVQAVGVDVGLDIAVPCGLILNELIANACKHAFPGDKPRAGAGNCEINVTMDQENGTVMLNVADNGVGLPAGMNLENPKTIGLQLIKMLSQQLNGSIELDRSAGTTFRLRFAKPSYSDKQISAEK